MIFRYTQGVTTTFILLIPRASPCRLLERQTYLSIEWYGKWHKHRNRYRKKEIDLRGCLDLVFRPGDNAVRAACQSSLNGPVIDLSEPSGWSVVCKPFNSSSLRSHLSSGVKYQLTIPKNVMLPKITQA